ncbi:diadenosine tetraphosphate hydrolase [Kiloniella litopenaei]|uniref:Diadenosine tetraphosphate hydrolase n=1 Tax=Kiloniella litopenaei TaxID=1549748 RepID=A0A0M2R836_9PROT|nr:HIT family protein [Kiloniella litopenaei]KKJ75683.1 diadenosine tetraphosphate hydrolase [Kiloniella litopenaei]
MPFALHERLEADTLFIKDLTHSRVLLMNDNQYPWLILVPRYPNLRDLHDLSKDQLTEVMEEVRLVSDILVEEFKAFKINVAALGNMVPQLHIHVIARYEDDPAWPGPVWGVHPAKAYDSNKAQALKVILETAIERGSIKPE